MIIMLDSYVAGFFVILAVFGAIALIGLINECKKNVAAHTELIEKPVFSNKTVQTPSVPMNMRIANTNSILEMIDTMIQNEISNTLRSCISLRKRYEFINMDDDIKSISTKVYKGLVNETFTNDSLMITGEYLMNYITAHSTLLLIATAQQYNSQMSIA